MQEPDTIGDVARIGGIDEREPGHLAETEGGHLQNDRGETGPQDFRFGEVRACLEVVLGVEPDADPVGEAPTTPGTLASARLGDRLDREALNLGALRVAGDPRGARVDDIPNAGHGQ